MNTINDRIREIIKRLFNENTRSFSVSINENYQTIRNIVGERNSIPSSLILESIIGSIELINAKWLLTGKGEMLKSEQDNKEAASKLNESDLVSYLKEEIEKLQIENKRLMKQNTYYELLLDNSGINYKQTAS